MSKGRLEITVGISNSGKSTWAHKQWLSDPLNIVLVNRDKIRELLFGFTEETISQYYGMDGIRKREKLVTRYEDTLINEGLEAGKTVIVDATHLRVNYLERFKYWNVETTLHFFEITVSEANDRDLKRVRQVGLDILRKQRDSYVKLILELADIPIDFTPVTFENPVGKPCIIFDIDGTVAQMGDRSPYAWLEVGKDTMDASTCAVVDWLAELPRVERPTVIICTGRDGESLDETQKWLDKNQLEYDEIYIRNKGDQRADWIVKEEMWKMIANKYHIVGMFDDRLQVVRRARALGLKVFNVEHNNF